MDAIKILIILSVMILFTFISCKTQVKHNDNAYNDIMNNSVYLLAKEEKGKVYPAKFMVFSDTLKSEFKSLVDSVTQVKNLQIKPNNK